MLVLVLSALLVGAVLEFWMRNAGPGATWTLALVPVLFGLVLLLRRYPGTRRGTPRTGMGWNERWKRSSFRDRFVWLYLPMALVIGAVLIIAVGPSSVVVVAVLLPPAMAMTVGVFELNYWLSRRRRVTGRRP